MKVRRKRKGATHGGHDPDSVLLGLHVSPEWKAIAKLTAMMMDRDVTTLLLDGLRGSAKKCGILDANDKVAPEWQDEVEMLARVVRAKKAERQNHGK